MTADLDRLLHLLRQADEPDGPTAGTSLRLPVALREAVAVARGLGLDASTTGLAVSGLRGVLDGFVNGLVLEEHYERHPEVRPELWEIALATAELDDDPLASQPELLRRAAEGVVARWPSATPDDVLRYAAGLAAASEHGSGAAASAAA